MYPWVLIKSTSAFHQSPFFSTIFLVQILNFVMNWSKRVLEDNTDVKPNSFQFQTVTD